MTVPVINIDLQEPFETPRSKRGQGICSFSFLNSLLPSKALKQRNRSSFNTESFSSVDH